MVIVGKALFPLAVFVFSVLCSKEVLSIETGEYNYAANELDNINVKLSELCKV